VVTNLTAIDNASLHIEWNLPTEANGNLTVYTIFYAIENGSNGSLKVPFNGHTVSYSIA